MPHQNQQNVKDPKEINRYSMFSTAINTSIGQTVLFSVGAAVRHQPVHKGALTALAGGAIIGAIVGVVGSTLGVKKENTSFALKACGFILEQSCLFATMPMGEKVVPFVQNLSLVTKIEDQLIGGAILSSPSLFVLLMTICCCCCSAALDPEKRKAAANFISEQFGSAELVFAVAEYVTPVDAQAVLIDIEAGPNPQINATPVRIQDIDLAIATTINTRSMAKM
ncbi:hypothetical protein [Legionella sp. km772]|uniref:hypothetical protein n=1 Tax=Legionella sp. km772 TaxID=2498111 RepID=UPI000F8F4267|nr:hypothetical protein [Legionella sp. km772]RUR05284.1 hypothetical protein ELY15_14505 [Legionella sp. km772]